MELSAKLYHYTTDDFRKWTFPEGLIRIINTPNLVMYHTFFIFFNF